MRFLLGFLFGASYTRNRVFRVAFLLLILFMVFASTRCQKLLATTGGCCTVSSDSLFPSIRRVLIVVCHETKQNLFQSGFVSSRYLLRGMAKNLCISCLGTGGATGAPVC
jgi:hypothetical protein